MSALILALVVATAFAMTAMFARSLVAYILWLNSRLEKPGKIDEEDFLVGFRVFGVIGAVGASYLAFVAAKNLLS